MPALVSTEVHNRVVWLGVVPSRELALASVARPSLSLTFAGPEGEDHAGLTRASCSRVSIQYRRGTEIRNTRQLCLMSEEETADIAIGIDVPLFDPAWAGATMVLAGIPDFSNLPPSTRLQFDGGATVTVDMMNAPCNLPARNIEAVAPGSGSRFKAAAKDRRGVTAWVEREGIVALGDGVSVHIPSQRPWLRR